MGGKQTKQAKPQIIQEGTKSIKLLGTPDDTKKTVAVIVTINNDGSYDKLFTTVQQKSIDGTKVEVYECTSFYINYLIDAFNGDCHDETSARMMKSIKQVDPDCVVFNWECSAGYFYKYFPEGSDQVFSFLKIIIGRGHMAMFSDFSLKALINRWKEEYGLGPNPFIETGDHSGHFQLRFDPSQLKQCPSAQLQTVGDLVDSGKLSLDAMTQTIVYNINQNKLNHDFYKLKVLTVNTTTKLWSKDNCKAGKHSGSAGHVLLTYPSGGTILTSMGHWIELMRIDTSADKLFEIAERQFGAKKAAQMKAEWQVMDVNAQKDYTESKAKQFVMNQAPCKNMFKKARI